MSRPPKSDGAPDGMRAAQNSPAIAALLTIVDRSGGTMMEEVSAPDGAEAAVLAWLLARCDPASGEAGELLNRIARMHAIAAEGQPASAEAWRVVRKRTLEVSDEAQGEQQALARVAEAAAWPLQGSRSLLAEVFTAVAPLLQMRRVAELGWTAADQARAFVCLDAIREELAAQGEPVDRSRIPALFAAREPSLEQRFVAQLDASNAAYTSFAGATLLQVRHALGVGTAA